jgi:hypothetical protein
MNLDKMKNNDKTKYMVTDYKSATAGKSGCYVVRFKSDDVVNLNIPRNKNNNGWLNDPNISDSFNKNAYPFTGNGFTSGQNGTLGVAELKAEYGQELTLKNGAEMYYIDNSGTQKLVGVYDDSKQVFIAK